MLLILLSYHFLFFLFLFFFNDTATTEIYTLSLHDALPIFAGARDQYRRFMGMRWSDQHRRPHYSVGVSSNSSGTNLDRKSTRLNSSYTVISYAVFCLKKKKKKNVILKKHTTIYK